MGPGLDWTHNPWISNIKIQEGLLSVTSKSMCTEYRLTATSKLVLEKSVVMITDHLTMTIAVAWDMNNKHNITLLYYNT